MIITIMLGISIHYNKKNKKIFIFTFSAINNVGEVGPLLINHMIPVRKNLIKCN